MTKRHAAFGFFRARRAMRRPDFHLAVVAPEFRAAVADQGFQRIRGGGDPERFHLVARRSCQRCVIVLRGRQAELPRQFGIERRDRRRGAVIGLRGLVETLPCGGGRRIAFCDVIAGPACRCPRAMRGGLATGAAVPGIVRRRLQASARAHARIAAIDRGIEQFRKRRPDRLHVRPVSFGFRGFAGLFGGIWFLRHGANMG